MKVKTNNPNGSNDCLSIAKDCWIGAVKDEQLTRAELCLYFFLANHADKEHVILNKEVFEEATGYKKTAYTDAIRTLKEKGYLIQVSAYLYVFYTAPYRVNGKVPNYMFGED